MIPKIIHYCWFGRGEKPETMKKCIESWHRCLPDYTFMEWNEDNFDIESSAYVKEAYENKKYAFVSDIARICALKEYGGIYMDTDVEVYQSFDPILQYNCVFGFEYGNWVATSFMACIKNHPALTMFEHAYHQQHFMNADGSFNLTTNVQRLTALMEEKGLQRENKKQIIDGDIVVFPIDYFSPYDYVNCVMEKTNNSYCAHLFLVTWMPKSQRIKKKMKKNFVQLFGKEKLIEIRKIVKRDGK